MKSLVGNFPWSRELDAYILGTFSQLDHSFPPTYSFLKLWHLSHLPNSIQLSLALRALTSDDVVSQLLTTATSSHFSFLSDPSQVSRFHQQLRGVYFSLWKVSRCWLACFLWIGTMCCDVWQPSMILALHILTQIAFPFRIILVFGLFPRSRANNCPLYCIQLRGASNMCAICKKASQPKAGVELKE